MLSSAVRISKPAGSRFFDADEETIERALDLVVFQRALVRGTRAMLGVRIVPPDVEA